MKKLVSIVSVLALLVFFTGCEKCAKPTFEGDPFVNATGQVTADENHDGSTKANSPNNSGGITPQGSPGDITDPNEDEDFDNIVDPDEDEDFDEDGK